MLIGLLIILVKITWSTKLVVLLILKLLTVPEYRILIVKFSFIFITLAIRFCNRVLVFIPVNSIVLRMVSFEGMVNFSKFQFLENSNKIILIYAVNRCSPFSGSNDYFK